MEEMEDLEEEEAQPLVLLVQQMEATEVTEETGLMYTYCVKILTQIMESWSIPPVGKGVLLGLLETQVVVELPFLELLESQVELEEQLLAH
jgi:hypothetical protein